MSQGFNPRPAIACGATPNAGDSTTLSTFQSAPRNRLRGDRTMPTVHRLWRCFNPRPAIACGATAPDLLSELARRVSIRAPQSLAGRPPASKTIDTTLTPFQSAPRNRLRGDRVVRLLLRRGLVSIRAP